MREAQVWKWYAELVSRVGDVTRSDAAREMGVSKSTATYHLERAVSEGVIERYYAWTSGNQTGWAYRPTEETTPLF